MESLLVKTLSIEKFREDGRSWSRGAGNPTSRTPKAGDAEPLGTWKAEREETVTRYADRSSTSNQRGNKRFAGFVRAGFRPPPSVAGFVRAGFRPPPSGRPGRATSSVCRGSSSRLGLRFGASPEFPVGGRARWLLRAGVGKPEERCGGGRRRARSGKFSQPDESRDVIGPLNEFWKTIAGKSKRAIGKNLAVICSHR